MSFGHVPFIFYTFWYNKIIQVHLVLFLLQPLTISPRSPGSSNKEWYLFIFKFYLFIFRERGEKEKEREKHIDVWKKHRLVASCTLPIGNLGYNLGMCPDWNRTGDFWFPAWRPNHWATPVRTWGMVFKSQNLRASCTHCSRVLAWRTSQWTELGLCVCMYICMHTCAYIFIHRHIHWHVYFSFCTNVLYKNELTSNWVQYVQLLS